MKKSVLSSLILLCLWHLIASGINQRILVPFPQEVILKMINQIQSKEILSFMGHTFLRISVAFILSNMIALGLIFLQRSHHLIKTVINQILVIIRIIPTAAIILMALVWLNANQTIILITLLVMIPLMTDLLDQQFNQIKKEYADPLKIYGSSPVNNLLYVYFPLILPTFLVLCKSAFLLGLKVTISSEVLVSVQQGLGRELQYARFDLDMTRLIATTGWIILIAVLITKLFDFFIAKTSD